MACLVRYSTYSTYSKEPGESGCSVAYLVRYSTYSTYSKDAGDCEGSAAWCLPRLPHTPPARHRRPAEPAPRSGFFPGKKFQSSCGGRTAARFFCQWLRGPRPARHRSPAEPAPRSGFFLGRISDFALHRGRFSDFAFCPKNPSPGQRRRSVSEAVLAGATDGVFFHHSHALPSILAWAQECSCQSCCDNRIASTIPALATGLPRCSCPSTGL